MTLQNGRVSYWRSRPEIPRPVLPAVNGDLSVDVAIVGGGLTGLWTAWSLVCNDPNLKVAVFEAEDLGFGASGRHGGWLSAKPVGMRPVLASGVAGRTGVIAADRILARSIHEVVDVLGADQIDAKHGGWMEVARTPSELARLETYLAKSRAWDVPSERLRLLSAGEAHSRVAVDGVRGALYSPDNYRVDPIKMLLRLADLALEIGVEIYTGSRVDDVSPGQLRVNGFQVRAAREIVIATEGYSRWERGQSRQLLPMNSAMLVTEKLTKDQWAKIGWEGG
ncbi:glycine/D-amino acid oxidase-like deaminating enzyme [Rhodococcus sp. 27YEA15]|uniref:NAD(P)/FAD-dependent oxidoreductase n=1 Tax=Rhodococcus sp. 27YEA15 TaxID=3156259 RepID=UPI003C7ECEA6